MGGTGATLPNWGEEREADTSTVCFTFSVFFFFFLHFSRKECGDLTLSIRPLDKFNHDVPSTKSRLNRNANNRAMGASYKW